MYIVDHGPAPEYHHLPFAEWTAWLRHPTEFVRDLYHYSIYHDRVINYFIYIEDIDAVIEFCADTQLKDENVNRPRPAQLDGVAPAEMLSSPDEWDLLYGDGQYDSTRDIRYL